jgi:TetR/AcrR family fatty acid metabolism transcriptional regulator
VSDPKAVGDAGPEAVQDDVCTAAESTSDLRLEAQVADHRFLARVEGRVPSWRDLSHRVAFRRLEACDSGAEANELSAGERPGQVAGQVDDEQPGQRSHRSNLYSGALTERSIGSEDKRQLILDAAVRVFARSGYHAARVGDIAAEAGVAHGLLYHYFDSKEELLATIFRETWAELLQALREVEDDAGPAGEQLRQVTAILLRSWRRNPDLVRVLVREVARSPQLGGRVDEIGQAFSAIERIIERGQRAGELRRDVDPRLASWIVYGALEEILTGWVLGTLPDGDEAVADAERTVVGVLSEGLRPVATEARRRTARRTSQPSRRSRSA